MILVFGCAFFSLFRPGIGTRWGQEPDPPVTLSAFELGKEGEILARSINGDLYEFRYGTYSSPSTWEKVSEPSGSPVIGMSCSPGAGNRIVLPPPGNVTSHVSVNCVYMESAYHLEVALLENGEVWSWEHESYAYTDLFLIMFLGIACLAGVPILLTGLGLAIYQKVKKVS